jgi:hypothetical protein
MQPSLNGLHLSQDFTSLFARKAGVCIRAALAIFGADYFINPPELGVAEHEIKKVKSVRSG